MLAVQKYNVILEIDDEELDKYLKLGYNQIDIATGKILNEAIPTDIGVLQCKYAEHLHTIEELNKQIELLRKPKKEKKQ